jgi:two-component system cell cycle sensor histidine kinase/response regulator CckA
MDPAQLEQVLVNLAVNARDAMPGGGELTIDVRNAGVMAADARGAAPGPHIVFRVSDTGTGMDEATRCRLFEPFFTTKPKGKGTGLGLAMVFGAVEQAGGRIDVASQLGAGTTFTIHLPRVPAPPSPRGDAPRAAAHVGGGERILVVEDEPQVRASVRLFLTGGGFSVIEAVNGEEGLAAFQADEEGIDLVLTDLVMPGMSGVALGRAIHARRSVPVLYMSGYSDDVFSGKEKLPAEHFLQKPFDRGTLLNRVRALLVEATQSSAASQ